MTVLFDPRFWLAIILWTSGVAFVSYQSGARVERANAEAREKKASNDALLEKILIDTETVARQRHLVRVLDNRDEKHYQEIQHEKARADRLIADLRADNRRLSIPIRYPTCPAGADSDPAVAGGTGEERRADLTPGAGEFLIRLVERGNEAIRKHAEVVDRYELIRKTCMESAP